LHTASRLYTRIMRQQGHQDLVAHKGFGRHVVESPDLTETEVRKN
jgi:hypothetical protein